LDTCENLIGQIELGMIKGARCRYMRLVVPRRFGHALNGQGQGRTCKGAQLSNARHTLRAACDKASGCARQQRFEHRRVSVHTAGGLLPALDATTGIWIGGRPNSTSPHTGDPQECCGTQTAGKTYLHNVLFARIPAAQASLIPTLALEMANNHHDYPRTLATMLA
jgi:hypothetical protein